MTASTSTPATATTGQRRRMIIAFGLFFIVTLGYIDRINISVTAPLIIEEFGLSTGQFGLALSALPWRHDPPCTSPQACNRNGLMATQRTFEGRVGERYV